MELGGGAVCGLMEASSPPVSAAPNTCRNIPRLRDIRHIKMQSREQPSQLCGVLYGSVTELRHHLTPLDPDLSSFEITRRSRLDLWMAAPDLPNVVPSFISESWRERHQPARQWNPSCLRASWNHGNSPLCTNTWVTVSLFFMFLYFFPPLLIPGMCGTNL